jgi:broad specificity phosphatase PhoE
MTTTKTLYFIRHGEAEHNVVGGDMTKFDPPLTKSGREQAGKIKGHVDLVIMSPLLRARETML